MADPGDGRGGAGATVRSGRYAWVGACALLLWSGIASADPPTGGNQGIGRVGSSPTIGAGSGGLVDSPMPGDLLFEALILIPGSPEQRERMAQPPVIATTDRARMCVPGYARSMRLNPASAVYRELLRAAEARQGPRNGRVLDHRVPLCAGGANSAANVWLQDRDEALRKDRIEVSVCRQICLGAISPADAQQYFLSGAWATRATVP